MAHTEAEDSASPALSRATSESASSSRSETEYYKLRAEQYGEVATRFPLPPEGQEYLSALTDVADTLGIDSMSFTSFSAAISHLSEEDLDIRRSSLHIHSAAQELVEHLMSARHEETLLLKWVEQIPSELESNEGVETLKRRKHALSTKAKEYQQELNMLMAQFPEEPPLNVSQLASYHQRVRAKEKILMEKRAKITAFQGLPPNLDLALHELSKARDEQMQLIQLRERLLDRMASGVS